MTLLEVPVDFLIGRFDELPKHIWRYERRDLAAPIIVVEQRVWLQICAYLFCIPQFPVGQALNQLVHFIRVFVEIHQAILNLKKMVTHLKDARSDDGGDILLAAVHFLRHSDIRLPVLLCIIEIRLLNVVSPVLNILDDNLIRGVDREADRKSVV